MYPVHQAEIDDIKNRLEVLEENNGDSEGIIESARISRENKGKVKSLVVTCFGYGVVAGLCLAGLIMINTARRNYYD